MTEYLQSVVDRQASRKQLGSRRSARDFVQQLSEYDKNNKEMNWNEIVAKATEVFEDVTTRRITVTVRLHYLTSLHENLKVLIFRTLTVAGALILMSEINLPTIMEECS